MAMRRLFTICLLILSATALLVDPSAASAATGANTSTPSITRVLPMRVSVGGTLTITGKNFRSTRVGNTVIFRASNGRSAFAKPRRASRGKLTVVVPGAVSRLLAGTLSKPKPTRLKLRVLAGKFSSFTPRRLSPVVTGFATGEKPGGGSAPGGSGGGSAAPGGEASSPSGSGGPVVVPVVCNSSADHDGDMLPNTLETALKTDPCLADTDGDKVQDGYEYKSAVDLNNDDYQEPNESLPYPGKRPYPNPLDPSDANADFDGDSLGLAVEQRLWLFSSNPTARVLDNPLSYSDGLQHSVYEFRAGQGNRRFPSLAEEGYAKKGEFTSWAGSTGYRQGIYMHGTTLYGLFDVNLDGTESDDEGRHYDLDEDTWLSDEERDEDADGLINFDEDTGRLQPTWWEKCYGGEKPYYVKYAGTDVTDPDSDGDGVRDGADDQDHDDLPNIMELSRIAASNPAVDDREEIVNHTGQPFRQNCKVAKAITEAIEAMGQEPPVQWHPGAYGRVNPFNPCLPATGSRSCNTHPTFGSAWAPFDDSPNWFALN
jgi:hypothetical protein